MTEDNQEVVAPNPAEAEARKFGWVPKDEWQGDGEKWKPAEDFLARGKEINGFLRRDFEIVNNKLSAKEKELNELRETVGELKGFYSNMSEKAYERAVKDLKEQRKQAIALGDGDAFEAVEEELNKLQQESTKKKETKKPEGNDENAQILSGWLKENPIFETDPEVQAIADGLSFLVKQKNPHLSGKEFLEELANQVKATVPHKFENPNKSRASPVGTSSDAGGNRNGSKKKSYDNLPAEAKHHCDRFVKQKLMTQEEYVNAYQWD